MHAWPFDPKHPLFVGTTALLLAIVLLAAAAPDLGSLQLSLGGGDAAAPASQPSTAAPEAISPSPLPTWAHEPLAPATERLMGR